VSGAATTASKDIDEPARVEVTDARQSASPVGSDSTGGNGAHPAAVDAADEDGKGSDSAGETSTSSITPDTLLLRLETLSDAHARV
jgi:hypothetical protein